MTANIIEKIEIAGSKVEMIIRNNHAEIQKTVDEFFNEKKRANSNAQFQAWAIANGFNFLFDAQGKPNKDGICKNIMSQHSKNIVSGMKKIHEQPLEFAQWAVDENAKHKGIRSLAKIGAIFPKAEKQEETASDESTNESEETATNEPTPQEQLQAMAAEMIQHATKNGLEFTDIMQAFPDVMVARFIKDVVQTTRAKARKAA